MKMKLAPLTGLVAALNLMLPAFGEEAPKPPRLVIIEQETDKWIPAHLPRAFADAIALQLSEAKLFEPVPQPQLEEERKRRRLTGRLTISQMAVLAQALDAPYMSTLRIVKAKLSKKRIAQVEMQLLIYEVETEDLVNGASVKGKSHPRPEQPDDVLWDEAIRQAAENAVVEIQATRLVEAQVLIRESPNKVILNKGTIDGIFAGMRMSVFREQADDASGEIVRRKIGEIVVEHAEARHSSASILRETVGIKGSDHVRQVFELLPPRKSGG